MEKDIIKTGDKYSKEDIKNIANSYENADILEKDDILKLYIRGIENMPGEYRIDYICTFNREIDDYIAVEENYNEVITNPLLFDNSKFIMLMILAIILKLAWIILYKN